MSARRPLLIGISGPIGCGKSTVAGWLGELGAVAIDADEVAREVTAPGEPALVEIERRFGGAVFLPDGSLDRQALADVVFADPAALADLEAIVHPAVRRRIRERLAAAASEGAPAVAVEAIKLVEGGLADECDEVWLVDCEAAEQRERLARRGLSANDAARRIASQGPIRDRLRPGAARIIATDGPKAETRTRVEAAYEAALAARPA